MLERLREAETRAEAAISRANQGDGDGEARERRPKDAAGVKAKSFARDETEDGLTFMPEIVDGSDEEDDGMMEMLLRFIEPE